MKKILLITIILFAFQINAQTLTETFKNYIQPNNSTKEILKGLQQINSICEVTPQDKCTKAKAMAYYLISNNYYRSAYQVFLTDKKNIDPILKQATIYYKKANDIMPINQFTEIQKNIMLNNKNQLTAALKN